MQNFFNDFGSGIAVEIVLDRSKPVPGIGSEKSHDNRIEQKTENFQNVSLDNSSFSFLREDVRNNKKYSSPAQKNLQTDQSLSDQETCTCRKDCCIL